MIQDLHAHTYYSFCGRDDPDTLLQTVIDGGIELFGICDHNYGIGFGRFDFFNSCPQFGNADYGRNLMRYYDHINLIREKYADRIRMLCGIEVCTLQKPNYALPEAQDISFFDYCLIENSDAPAAETVTKRDLFSFAERCGCPAVGVAHTDLFGLIAALGEDPYRYFRRMAQQNIFWEMNVSCDSIHGYREHAYMLRFFEDPEQQAIIREAGVRLSVGFDGHRVEDYLPDRVADYCRRISDMGIRLVFE